jgi:class 3 adenylate cyclase
LVYIEGPHGVPPLTAAHLEYNGAQAERRQITVMFRDVVESTALSTRLDPEKLREIMHAYQATCAEVIEHFEGHIAQYLGDSLLVYYGYPFAHEDDAHRALRTGLAIINAMETLNTRLAHAHNVQLAVRIGIHTGLVVIGEIGGGRRHEHLALGQPPNIASRLQSVAQPNTIVISDATYENSSGFRRFGQSPGTP